MFNLEQSILEWRKQMLAAGIKTPVPLEELENHLRGEIERQIESGSNEQKAFEVATAQIGQAQPLKMEFKKIAAGNWNRPLAWSVWALFVASFFMPAHQYGGMGWQCAYMSAHGFIEPEFWRGELSGDFHLTLLTLANALMIVSPLFLMRFSQKAKWMKWFLFSTLAALALVWSFILRLMTHSGDASELKFGCYVWGISFVPLCLSLLKMSNRVKLKTAN